MSEAIFIKCLGEQLVIYRTQNNKVFIVDAYCPHLGANLGIGGRVDGDCIVCPFHQWSFRGSDGKCTKIPYSTSGKLRKNIYSKYFCFPLGISENKSKE